MVLLSLFLFVIVGGGGNGDLGESEK